LSSRSISLATETPSLVVLGAPYALSITTFLPLGPRVTFTVLAILVTGASLGLVMFYQTISAFFAALTHANISVPKWLDKPLSFIFVTPDFHKIHHHYILPHTDSNYGNIFSIWDYIFSTTSKLEIIKLKYGIDTYMKNEEHSKIKNLLLIPFQEYRTPVGGKFEE